MYLTVCPLRFPGHDSSLGKSSCFRPVNEEMIAYDNLLGLSDESATISKIPMSRIQEIFPESTADVSAENFSPER